MGVGIARGADVTAEGAGRVVVVELATEGVSAVGDGVDASSNVSAGGGGSGACMISSLPASPLPTCMPCAGFTKGSVVSMLVVITTREELVVLVELELLVSSTSVVPASKSPSPAAPTNT